MAAAIVQDIFRAANLLYRMGGKISAQAGLATVQQWAILAAVAQEEGIALKDLRRNTLVTKQAITGLVERLRQGGYLKTYGDTADRRVTRVSLTEQGKTIIERLQPIQAATNRKTFSVFGENHLCEMQELLQKLVDSLSRELGEDREPGVPGVANPTQGSDEPCDKSGN